MPGEDIQILQGHLQCIEAQHGLGRQIGDRQPAQGHVAVEFEAGGCVLGLLEARLHVHVEAGAGQLEAGLEGHVVHVAGQVHVRQFQVEHGLLRFGEGLGAPLEVKGRVVHLGTEHGFDKHVHVRRQGGDEGQAKLEIGDGVQGLLGLVVEFDTAVFEMDVVHGKARGLIRGRLAVDQLDDVVNVVVIGPRAHQMHVGLAQAYFLHHRCEMPQGVAGHIHLQGIEGDEHGLAIRLQQLEPLDLHLEGIGIDVDRIDAELAVQLFLHQFFRLGLDDAGQREIAKEPEDHQKTGKADQAALDQSRAEEGRHAGASRRRGRSAHGSMRRQ